MDFLFLFGSEVWIEASQDVAHSVRDRVRRATTGSRRAAPVSLCAIIFVLILSRSSLCAQTTFGTQAVGSSSQSHSISVSAQAPGTVSTVQVLTWGAAGMDFEDLGGSCLGTSVAPSGPPCTESIVFKPVSPGLRSGAVVLLDSQDSVLGEAFVSGIGEAGLGVYINYRNMVPVAGMQGSYGQLGDGKPATQAQLYLPSAVAVDGLGNLYIADSAHHRIRKVDAGTQTISTIAGIGSPGYSGDGGPASNARLSDPEGISIDGAGNLYIADTGNNAVREVLAISGTIVTVAGNGAAGDSGDGGLAIAAELSQPVGVTVDLSGALYIADTGNSRIKMVVPVSGMITSTSIIQTVAGNGMAGYAGDGNTAILAELDHPFAVAFDSSGNMYIPDSGNNCVRIVRSAKISTFAGLGPLSAGYTGDSGSATAAQLWTPTSVATDVGQNVYIADTQNGSIRKVNSRTGVITTVVRSGYGSGYYNNKISGNTLYAPTGLAVDGTGNLYIADRLNMVVRELFANQSAIVFSSTRQGSTSSAIRNYIENDGNAPLVVSTTFPGANAQIDAASTTCVPGSVNVGKYCSVGVVFAPAVAGNPVAGAIDVNLESVNSPMLINVIGNATPINSTQITLLSSQNPISAGLQLTLTAIVMTGDSKPLNGSVKFSDGTVTIGTVPVDGSGVAKLNVSNLSMGSHTIGATYAGDTNGHLDSAQTTVTQIVDEATTTSLTSNVVGGQSIAGSSVTLTAAVSIQGNGNVPPDGTMLFLDGSNTFATVAVNPGIPTIYTTSSLSNGPHTLTASYSGNSAKWILGSDSPALTVNVVAPASILLSASTITASFGTPVTFTATLNTSGGTAPSGIVKFLDGVNELGPGVPTGAAGVFVFTTSSLVVGSHSITATYTGDLYNQSVVSAPVNETVNPAPTATILSLTPNPGIAGKSTTLTATVVHQSGSGTGTGMVTFTDGSVSLGSATLSVNGIASISVAFSSGTHTLGAAYSGDANNAASSSGSISYHVNRATTSITLKSDHPSAVALAPVTFTATVSGNGGIPTGTVEFQVDGSSIGSSPLDASGTAELIASQLALGTRVVTASYAGDANNLASQSSPISEIVQAIATTTHLTSSQASEVNTGITLVATAIAGSGPVPTGTIAFNSGSTLLGTATLDVAGVATFAPVLGPGTSTITATYGGDAIHAGSTSSSIQVNNDLETFIVSLKPPDATISTTQNVTISVSLASQNGFQDTLGLGCVSLPAPLSCHFSSTSVTVKSGEAKSVDLTIDTNTPLGGGPSARNLRSGLTAELAGLFLPAGLLLGAGVWRARRRSLLVIALLGWILTGAVFLDGCGSSITLTSAKPGTYTFHVGAVGQSTKSQQYQAFTLTVTH